MIVTHWIGLECPVRRPILGLSARAGIELFAYFRTNLVAAPPAPPLPAGLFTHTRSPILGFSVKVRPDDLQPPRPVPVRGIAFKRSPTCPPQMGLSVNSLHEILAQLASVSVISRERAQKRSPQWPCPGTTRSFAVIVSDIGLSAGLQLHRCVTAASGGGWRVRTALPTTADPARRPSEIDCTRVPRDCGAVRRGIEKRKRPTA